MAEPVRAGATLASLGRIEAGAGAPLVLLHGVGMCAAAWMPQIEALAAGHRVVALDLPGHGGTADLGGTPDLPDYVAWAAARIRALGLGPVAVAGHSMGALIALGLAIEHPDLVARLCLLNPVYERGAAARAAVEGRARDMAGGQIDPEAPLARWFAPGEAPAMRMRVGGWLRAVDPAGYARTYGAFARGDAVYAGRLGEIACPTLVLTAEGDGNSTPEMTRAMAGAIPGGRAVVIAERRHMVPMTDPGLVNAHLAEWLAG